MVKITIFRILDVLQIGIFSKWKKKYAIKNGFCKIYEPAELTTASTKPLTLQEVAGILLVLAAGFVFSCIVLMAEMSRICRSAKQFFRSKLIFYHSSIRIEFLRKI